MPVVAMVAVVIATAVVLRDIVTYGRPPRPATPKAPKARPAPAVPVAPVVVAEPVVDDGSILSGLASVEHDESSSLRRLGAAIALLTITLVTAGALGGLIYRAVAGLK